ncbi:asparagine synthase-related protein [Limnohabitans sp. WS1]|uniref:asparagine synthase-related protein n=1 Tax=Limnohabitans sp. WS1 TaxID=1100726 RepID=UPI000D34EFA1|nr:asparagine synthase-related protein [Limnohabitans sp. WS1]PUE17956.1 hypothetical protein B9Z48_10255 [Limnohabitans sp. WS1]
MEAVPVGILVSGGVDLSLVTGMAVRASSQVQTFSIFDLQRKQGFSIPMNVWLKGGPFGTLFDDVLRDPQCSFDAQTVNKLMRDQDKGHFNGERLFGLVMFELWRREYGISF